jgi:2'-5' RNA ligase
MSAVGDSALACFLPGQLAEMVDRWRTRFDPHVGSIAPHITVTYPPFIPQNDWLRFRGEVTACVAGFTPFEVDLNSTGVFDETPLVLWLHPDDGGHFAHMHGVLSTRFPQYMPPSPFDYIPHVTIGFFETREALEQAQRTVMRELQPMHFQVKALALGVLDADMKWQFEDRLPLGG